MRLVLKMYSNLCGIFLFFLCIRIGNESEDRVPSYLV